MDSGASEGSQPDLDGEGEVGEGKQQYRLSVGNVVGNQCTLLLCAGWDYQSDCDVLEEDDLDSSEDEHIPPA